MAEQDFTRAALEEHLAAGRLMGVRCPSCQGLSAVPRAPCPACRGTDLQWVELSGRGTVVGFTVVHVPPTPLCAAGYGRDNPYAAAVVRLAEGPWITARLVGVDASRPETIRVGMPVRVEFLREGTRTVLAFRPEG
ncbi:MAG: Zn-ribbon domain-containing OB-fold protein [Candidatus Acetothermia bacterium]|jgi:uncharacterized OB-fold protein|nr:Zn-ribbon domain-containing OB-fold protein [Candidatus Acetothermia bacterium]